MRSVLMPIISFCFISIYAIDLKAQTEGELSLDQAIQIALKNNLSIRVSGQAQSSQQDITPGTFPGKREFSQN
jgi:hypothetical protein